MIFFRVALFVLAFNLTLGFMNGIPVDALGNDLSDQPFTVGEDNNWNATERAAQWNASAQNLDINNLGFGDIPGGFNMLVGAISDSTITMHPMLTGLGLPASLASVLTGLSYLTYIAGAIQIWTGRNIEK